MNFRKNDTVAILTGDDGGSASEPRTGRVLRVMPKEGKVVVEGINRAYRHLKPSRRNPQGGRLSKEMPIDSSNVQLFCPNCRRGVRVGRRYAADGSKERFCKKCGSTLGQPLTKPNEKYAHS